MKTYKILLVSSLILGVTYFVLDRQLFYYGKNDFNCYDDLLPLNIKPVFRYDFEGGFALEEDGFYLVSIGECQYVHSEIKLNVKEFANYYFNKEKLIAQIVNIDDRIYYIEFICNDSPLIKQDIIVKVWNNDEVLKSDGFKCVNIKGNKSVERIEFFRNIIRFVVTILIVIIICKTFISTKKVFLKKSITGF